MAQAADPLRVIMAGSPQIVLATSRLLLRHFQEGDAPLLTELDSDPEVKRFIDEGAPPQPENNRDAIARNLKLYIEHPGFGFFATHVRETGRFIGWMHFRPDRECA